MFTSPRTYPRRPRHRSTCHLITASRNICTASGKSNAIPVLFLFLWLTKSMTFTLRVTTDRVTETVQELKKLFKPPSAQVLVNVEKKSKYPFIIFGPLSPDFDTRRFVPTASCKVLSPELRINDGIYDVCGSIFRPGSGFSEQDVSVQASGFVISAFQTFPGEDSQRLEDNWITWTGQYSPFIVPVIVLILAQSSPSSCSLIQQIFHCHPHASLSLLSPK